MLLDGYDDSWDTWIKDVVACNKGKVTMREVRSIKAIFTDYSSVRISHGDLNSALLALVTGMARQFAENPSSFVKHLHKVDSAAELKKWWNTGIFGATATVRVTPPASNSSNIIRIVTWNVDGGKQKHDAFQQVIDNILSLKRGCQSILCVFLLQEFPLLKLNGLIDAVKNDGTCVSFECITVYDLEPATRTTTDRDERLGNVTIVCGRDVVVTHDLHHFKSQLRPGRDTRGTITTSVRIGPEPSGRSICISNVHLDVYDVQVALKQAAEVVSIHAGHSKTMTLSVLAGDLNSLNEKDYTADVLSFMKVNDQHRNVGDQFAVQKMLQNHGFTDSLDILSFLSQTGISELIGDRSVSCWSKRRPDAILLHTATISPLAPSFLAYVLPRVGGIVKMKGSDHWPVYVDLQLQ